MSITKKIAIIIFIHLFLSVIALAVYSFILSFTVKMAVVFILIQIISSLIIFLVIDSFLSKPLKNHISKIKTAYKNTGMILPDDNDDEMILAGTLFDKMNNRLAEALTRDKLDLDLLSASKEELKKLEIAIENTFDHIFITDPAGTIIYTNKAGEEITGFEKKELIGNTPSLWGRQMGRIFYDKLWETIRDKKQMFKDSITNKNKNKEKYEAELKIVPVTKDGEIIYYIGIEKNITGTTEVDRAKNDFVSLASHQLCTPLSAINWYTEMLLAGDAGKLNDEQTDYLKQVYHNNKRMILLVNALLNVSRIDLGTFSIEPEPTDLIKIIEEVIAELPPIFKDKKVNIDKDFDTTIKDYPADPNLFRIVIQNLISNSIKYTPEGGNIFLSIKKADKGIRITFKDTGCGIPLEQQEKLFSKFFRADNVRRLETDGTGLGLYIVKAIIEQAGGKVSFESVVDKGTTFKVELPESGMKSKKGTKRLS